MQITRRSHRCRSWRPRLLSPPQRIERGEGGERALQDWLDRSGLAYLFLDQTPLTMPATYRADIKRPDFLVAVDGIGTVAVDAKAKAFIDGCLVLDASERRRLDDFESTFGIPVWYACFPPAEPRLAYLFRNRALMGQGVIHDSARLLDRGYGTSGVDFLRERAPRARHVITNPPYGGGMADKFIGKALTFTRHTGGKVAMLLDLAGLCHPSRHARYVAAPPATIYGLDELVRRTANTRSDSSKSASMALTCAALRRAAWLRGGEVLLP